MKALLEAGADPNKETCEDTIPYKPLNFVIVPDEYNSETHEFSPLAEGRGKRAALLLEYGADPNSIMPGGEMPLAQALTYAAGTVREELVTLLLDKGADPAAAIAGMEQMGEAGSPEYYYALHELYRGTVKAGLVPPDDAKSAGYLQRAAAAGYPPALAELKRQGKTAPGKESALDALLDYFKQSDNSAWVCRPAAEEDIALCKKNLEELALEPLPPGYADFLKICNGFAWNGVEFWGTAQVSDEKDSSYSLTDLVAMNDDLDGRYSENLEAEVFYLGRADEDIYVYTTGGKRYEVRSMEEGCREAYESFGTFAELFMHVVGGRLGWNPGDEGDEPDEGRYDGEV
jgi:TPR repeat protein